MLSRSTTAGRKLTVTAMLVVTIGCGQADDDSGARGSGVSGDSAAAAGVSPGAAAASDDDGTPPGEIPESLSSITSKALLDHVATLRFQEGGKGTSHERDCDGASHSAECRLVITPVAGVRKFDATTLTSHGAIIARIENVGTRREARLDIAPRAVHYWLVVKEAQGPRSYLLDLSGERPRVSARLGFVVCTADQAHPKPPHGQTTADFKCCGQCPQHLAPHTVRERQYEEHTSPPWTSCALGCCYAAS
jgi:hypothetical protein